MKKEQQNSQAPLHYILRLRLATDEIFYGPGVAQLLQLVEETGSLNKAALHMGMAYSKAWKVMNTAERHLGFKLLCRVAGGKGGGGSQITKQGRRFYEKFNQFETETAKAADAIFIDIFAPGWEAEEEKNE